MAPSAVDCSQEYYPTPFPPDVPTISLAKISLEKLLRADEDEAQLLFDVCTHEGFFYLDLTTTSEGLKFLDESQQLHQFGKYIFNHVSIDDKRSFKPTDAIGHLDSGYKCTSVDDRGEPDKAEFINLSQHGLFSNSEPYNLPPWLSKNEHLYRSFMTSGNTIANVILSILERQVHLPPTSFTSLHKLTDSSGDFLRMFRYPAPKDGKALSTPPTPAHTDAVSVAILFNWQGGLQITKSKEQVGKVDVEDTEKESEDSWLYVKPEPGHAIVNLGDVMVVLTNGLLKSGRHRVVTPPGPQGRFHRYSVLVSTRPADQTIMKPFRSDMIDPETPEQLEGETLTALQWGMRKVRAILNRMEK